MWRYASSQASASSRIRECTSTGSNVSLPDDEWERKIWGLNLRRRARLASMAACWSASGAEVVGGAGVWGGDRDGRGGEELELALLLADPEAEAGGEDVRALAASDAALGCNPPERMAEVDACDWCALGRDWGLVGRATVTGDPGDGGLAGDARALEPAEEVCTGVDVADVGIVVSVWRAMRTSVKEWYTGHFLVLPRWVR